jgi:hypothetical protein
MVIENIPNAGIASTEGGFWPYLIGKPACSRAMKRDDALIEEIPKVLLRAML